MPLIGAGFLWLFRGLVAILPWIVEKLALRITRKIAVAVAVVAAFAALTTAFYAVVYGVVSGLSVITPPGFSSALGLFLPSNAYLCISAVLATYAARWLYDMQLRVLAYTNPGAGY